MALSDGGAAILHMITSARKPLELYVLIFTARSKELSPVSGSCVMDFLILCVLGA